MGMLTDIMCEQIERREGTMLDRSAQWPREKTITNQPGPHEAKADIRYSLPVGHWKQNPDRRP